MATSITNRSRNIDIYFNEIRRSKDLTREDEEVLFEEVSNGNQKAYNEIIMRTSKYAVSVAKTYTNDPDLLEDLIQEANMGLMTAICKFDINKGFRFISYAVHWMKSYINNFIDDNSNVGIKHSYIKKKADTIRKEIFAAKKMEATDEEVLLALEEQGISAEYTDITNIRVDTVDKVWDDGDNTVLESGELSLLCSSSNSAERAMDIQYAVQKVKDSLSILTEREKRMVLMNFGIGYDYPMDYKQIAKLEGLGQERVRQIVVASIEKMHKAIK